MGNWVYLFSKFTTEALLFEALAIFLLLGSYASFWVLKKRRLGVLRETVPTGVVKDYLNVLIADAEQLRAQLFGLLASQGIRTDATRVAMPAMTSPGDPALAAKASQLEARMAEQTRAMDSLMAEKNRIEKDLVAAKAASTTAAPGTPVGSDPMVPKLQEKISSLESRLAEYSVIEDDLANLKRLQQENAQLKAALSGKGGEMAAVAAVATTAASTEPMVQAPAEDFEKLVDQVEESLKPAAEAAPSLAPEPTAVAATPAPAPAATATTKSDEDLVAEFEKMLNG